MRRRAGGALAAALAIVAIGAPVAVGASPFAAGAATTATEADAAADSAAARTASGSAAGGQQSGQSPASVVITGMTPKEATAGQVITVKGAVTNSSSEPVSHLLVELASSSTPIANQADLQPSLAEQAGLAGTAVPGATVRIGQVQPRTTVHWSIQLKDSKIGMSVFGVYPIEALLLDTTTQQQLSINLTYLPYTPPAKGPGGYSIPARVKISWLWPLISTPLLAEPWQSDCSGPQAKALATSLSSAGRLGQLVEAGAASAGTADTYGTAVDINRSGRVAAATEAAAARSGPSQNLAGYDGITWAIDPALLADVKSLAACGATQQDWARTASAWLNQLQSVSAGQPMFVTPYADPNAGSLIRAGHSGDVEEAFSLGWAIAQKDLGRDLRPTAGSTAASGASDPAALYWPSDGTANYATLEALHGDGVQTAVLGSQALADPSATVTKYLNGSGGYDNLVVASQSLTHLLGSGGSTQASVFATGQLFLAQTVLLAQQDPGQPIVVAPPQRWGPAPGLAHDLLADTGSASWLTPASLSSLTTGRLHKTPNDAQIATPAALNPREAHLLARVDRYVGQVEVLKASTDPSLYQVVATDESSAWRGRAKTQAMHQLMLLVKQLKAQEQDVQIVAEKRVTLGGLKGSVPVSIANRLGYPVEVQLTVSKPGGFGVTMSRDGLITIPARDTVTVKLHVAATAVGSNTIVISLLNQKGAPLKADPARMTIQATQVGVLGTIIVAIALGVFLIAYAARTVRRGRAGAADDAVDRTPGDDISAAEESTARTEPDTVMAEQNES